MTETQSTSRHTRTPRFSVLMPAYNPGPYLEPALRSALDQLGPADELVVQDARSTDGSAALFDDFAAADPRVKVVHEPDDGQSDALNRALARAQGDWVIWLNADDILVDGALDAVRAAVAEAPGLDLAIGGHQMIRADGGVIDDFAGHPLTIARCVTLGPAAFSGSIVMRTEFLRKVGGFDASLNTVMDLELQLRMAAENPAQARVPAPVGALRFHEASKTANIWTQFVAESHRVRFSYADSAKLKVLAGAATVAHMVIRWVFRLKLTPGYRRLRSAVLRRS